MKWVRTHSFWGIDVKKQIHVSLVIFVFALLAGCASTPNGKNWKENKRRREMGMPSKFKPDADEIPAEVRQIEVQIDQPSVILAGDAVIYVSKNYEFDISLTGDDVVKDTNGTGAQESVARGAATAFVRNLKVSCDRTIRVKIADFGTKPFIKISARGHCSHIIMGNEVGNHEVKRARKIQINNANVQYFGQLEERPVGARN